VLGLDRLLQTDDRGALLLEGPLLVRVQDTESNQLPVKLRDIGVPLLQRRPRLLESSMLSLKRRPGISESGPLLLELTLGFLAGGTLLPELLLRCYDRDDLGGEGGLPFFGLLGPPLGLPRPLLGPGQLGLRLQKRRADLPVLGPDGDHLRLPVRRHGTRPIQVPPRLLQCLIPVDEGRANLLDGGGMRRGLPLQLQELVPHGLRPVRQPAVPGPQGLREGVESAALLSELVSSTLSWSRAPYLSRAHCSSSCRQQTKPMSATPRRQTRKRQDQRRKQQTSGTAEQRENPDVPRRHATQGRRGSAAPRSAPG
jgi:hypothetical protein